MDGYLLWESPDGTLSILVSRSLLGRLKVFTEEAFAESFAESGAVLRGRSETLVDSGRRVITIQDFESGMSGLHDASVVGFVRCRRQGTLHLDETAFNLLKGSPDLVCLVVRPDREKGAVGGFFYREDKIVRYPGAAMQFAISPDAVDCRGLLCPGSEPVKDEEDEARHGTKSKRLAFATAGLALILTPVGLWWSSRQTETVPQDATPVITQKAVQSEPETEQGSTATTPDAQREHKHHRRAARKHSR